jgi:hypothetical protein
MLRMCLMLSTSRLSKKSYTKTVIIKFILDGQYTFTILEKRFTVQDGVEFKSVLSSNTVQK